MYTKITASILVGILACAAEAQTTPNSLTKIATYPGSMLGVSGGYYAGACGIEFDPTGQKLFISKAQPPEVWSVDVVRNASGTITGFTNPTKVMTSVFGASGWFEGGLTFSQAGTMFVTGFGYGNYPLDQYVPSTGTQAFDDLQAAGIPGEWGGCGFITGTNGKERLLVSNGSRTDIYEVPLTLKADLTYTLGTATVYASGPGGIDGEGIASVPFGPFAGKAIVAANFNDGTVHLLGTDPTTRDPFLDRSGKAIWIPVISGLNSPMDIAFDPLLGDMFITQYYSANNTLLQFSGVVTSLDGDFVKLGAGCRVSTSNPNSVPTLTTGGLQVTAGQSTTILLLKGAKNQTFSFLVFGLGDLGNLGAFKFPSTECTVFVNPMLSVGMGTSGQGTGAFTFTVPPAAIGIPLFMQQWSSSPGSNPLNLAVSDAFAAVVN